MQAGSILRPHHLHLILIPTHCLPPIPPLQASSLIPDNVRKSLSMDQVKTLEAEAEKAKKAMEADLDPWFGEAEAEDNTIASFAALQCVLGLKGSAVV